MAVGNPRKGLLKAMIDVIRFDGPSRAFTSLDLTEKLLRAHFWRGKKVVTPERTVNSYCSQNLDDVFDQVGADTYRLKKHLW
jgi:hypothetical protein